ncbi:MAG: hypothetical protein ACREX0_01265 [Noviherbaspirillum sp.]
MGDYLMNATRYRMGAVKTLLSVTCGFWAAAIFGISVAPPLWAQGADAKQTASAESRNVAGRYPAGSIKSLEMADTALADVRRERAEIEARFSIEEQACHPKFFATSCVDEAKERRRQALAQLRPIEIEAGTYKRQARVTERDQALESKRKQADQAGHKEDTEKTAAPAIDVDDASKPDGGRKVQTRIYSDRQVRHEAKLKRAREEEAAEAKKRAENVAAYEKKVQAAQERQREVEARKAEKEQKRRMKEAPPANPVSGSTGQ